MKSFSEIAEVKVTRDDLPSIYCDMDMVLCDFMKSADNVVIKFICSNRHGKDRQME